jgi:hypothetical protein
MARRFLWVFAYAFLLFFLSGCGTLRHLNDPSRSKPSVDVANLLSRREIPYETAEQGGVLVSYNLFHGKSSNLSGYRLTLIFRNNTGSKQLLEPVISLQDASGFIIAPYAYQAFVTEAASLAGTVVPPISISNQTNYYHSGTIRNTATGNTYSYSGTTTSTPGGGFVQGLAQGMTQGTANRAAKDRDEGRLMLRWANSFWLKSAYELPPGTAASGALFFPAAQIGQLPLRLNIEIAGQKFEFVTVGGSEQTKP